MRFHRRFLFLWSVCVVCLLWAAVAQGLAAEVQPAQEEPYRIQSGDVLAVVVFGEPELSFDVPVLPDGTISFPYAPNLRVVGLTPSEVARAIEAGLADVVRTPVVSVSVRTVQGPYAVILGEVRQPGIFPIRDGMTTLLELVALAGGTTAQADLQAVKVYARGSVQDYRSAPIGVDGSLFDGDAAENPALFSGHIVYVPPLKADVQVYVLGEVRNPGAYAVEPGREVRLLDVIARAGGTTPIADLAEVKVYERGNVRDYTAAPIGAEGVLFDGEAATNPVVAVGNIIYVPPIAADNEVFVLGEVRNPGAYPVEPGREVRLLEIIARAGGTTPSADLAEVKVYERGNVRDFTAAPIGAEGVLFDGEAAANPVVAVGNIIYVPPVAADQEIFILGEVRNPGAYPVEPGREVRLLDIIARAGGTTPTADLAEVKVYERGNVQDYTAAPIGAEGVLFDGEAATNPVVAVGNIIYVPPVAADQEIFILGEVRNPGAYPVEPGREVRLLDVIARAGGTTPTADLAEVKVYERGNVRDFTAAPIGAEGVLFEGEAAANPVVAVGNIIYVPPVAADQEIFILGEVRNPGAYAVEPGREVRLLDIIARAGGTTPSADLAEVKVYERGNVQDYTAAPIGAEGVLFDGEAATNPVVAVGNIIYVPPVAADLEIFILGEVRNPGAYAVDPVREVRLLDIIARAGGTTPAADLTGVRVYERGNVVDYTKAPIGAQGVLFEGNTAENPILRAGNIVYVPPGGVNVTVIGLVRNPGTFRVDAGTRLLELLGLAGGLQPDADATNLILRRQSLDSDVEQIRIDLPRVLRGEVPGGNVELRAGDVLYVQPSIQVAVAGEVRNNGVFRLRGGSRLSDAILAAGGVTEDADLERVTISRKGENGQQILSVDYAAVLQTGGENPLVQEGDIVYVPRTLSVVYVAGEVHQPGAYRVTPTSRLLDVVYAAGGPTPAGDTEAVVIYEALKGPEVARNEAESAISEPLPPGDPVFAGPIERNPVVKPGQTVYVPKRMMEIFVLGSVDQPGLREVPRTSRILDVVAALGGPNESGDWRNVQILRSADPQAEAVVVDVMRLLEQPGSAGALNVAVHPGDAVYIPPNVTRVSVIGEVARPGTYVLPRDADLVDAVAAAGGAGPQAALERVSIVQQGEGLEPLEVRLGQNNQYSLEGISQSFSVRDGDVVVVPKSNRITWEQVIAILGGIRLIKDLIDDFSE